MTEIDFDGRVCLVTGATSGIGIPACVELARRGATVVLTGRSRERGEEALRQVRRESGSDRVELRLADLASFATVRRLAADVRHDHDRLHLLVNNAGLYAARRSETADGIETTLHVNHFAHFLLTRELLDLLVASAPAQVINVSSGAHRRVSGMGFEDLQMRSGFNGRRMYSRSKLANVLFTMELARRLEGTGVRVNATHPGVVATRIWNRNRDWKSFLARLAKPFMRSPGEGGRAILAPAIDPRYRDADGKYFDRGELRESSPASRDREAARRLWEVSEELTRPS